MKMTALSNVCIFLYFSFSESMRNEQKRHGNIDQLLRDNNCQIKGFIEKKVKIIWKFENKNTQTNTDLRFAFSCSPFKQKLEENITIDIDRILMKLEQLPTKSEKKTFKSTK